MIGMVALVALVMVLSFPAAIWMVAVRTRGAVGALGLWWAATLTGMVRVEGWEGLFGLPPTLGVTAAIFLAGMWAYDFVRLVRVAVGTGMAEASMWPSAKENIHGF